VGSSSPRGRWRERRRLIVYYDGACSLCRRARDRLKRLDWLDLLEFVSFRDPDVVTRHGLDTVRLERRMQARPSRGSVTQEGFDAVWLVATRVPLLWPALPALALAKWTGLGRVAYDWVSAQRHGAGLVRPRSKNIR
jgi:predicted DCC family thiol-disulfide oxidoreductase YuxK